MEVRVSRTARKHRIGNAHMLHALTNATSTTAHGDAYSIIGTDDRGIELHLIIVPDNRNPEGWTIIHCQPTSQRRKP